jgi:hypothetical protein
LDDQSLSTLLEAIIEASGASALRIR